MTHSPDLDGSYGGTAGRREAPSYIRKRKLGAECIIYDREAAKIDAERPFQDQPCGRMAPA